MCTAFHPRNVLHRRGYTEVTCLDAACSRCAARVPYLHHRCVVWGRWVWRWGLWVWQQFAGDVLDFLDSRIKSDKVGVCLICMPYMYALYV